MFNHHLKNRINDFPLWLLLSGTNPMIVCRLNFIFICVIIVLLALNIAQSCLSLRVVEWYRDSFIFQTGNLDGSRTHMMGQIGSYYGWFISCVLLITLFTLIFGRNRYNMINDNGGLRFLSIIVITVIMVHNPSLSMGMIQNNISLEEIYDTKYDIIREILNITSNENICLLFDESNQTCIIDTKHVETERQNMIKLIEAVNIISGMVFFISGILFSTYLFSMGAGDRSFIDETHSRARWSSNSYSMERLDYQQDDQTDTLTSGFKIHEEDGDIKVGKIENNENISTVRKPTSNNKND